VNAIRIIAKEINDNKNIKDILGPSLPYNIDTTIGPKARAKLPTPVRTPIIVP
jgi:hypothetical protein